MSITRFGYDIVGMVVLAVLLGSLLAWFAIDLRPVPFAVIGLLFAVLLLTLNFFRDPDRVTPAGDNLVIAPADGKVVLIQDLYEGEYLQADAVQISIFMSPLDVHVTLPDQREGGIFPPSPRGVGLAMLIGRLIMIIPALALAGRFARRKRTAATGGSFPVSGLLFSTLLVGTILIVGALTFFPALALGPIVEHFLTSGSSITF